MRNVLILIIGLLLGGVAKASNRPFTEGCKWSYCEIYYRGFSSEYYVNFRKYELRGTYELNGKTYMKVYSSYCGDAYYDEPSEEEFVIGIREEEGCVYADYDEFINLCWSRGAWPELFEGNDEYGMRYIVTEDNEVLLYNFNFQVGDLIERDEVCYPDSIVEIKPIELINGEIRNYYRARWHSFIYGIGSDDKDLIDWLVNYPAITDGSQTDVHLNVYVEDDELLYKAPKDPEENNVWKITSGTYQKDPYFGDLVTGIKEVKSGPGTSRTEAVYDLGGRRMDGKLKPGVYIRGGRKVVVR